MLLLPLTVVTGLVIFSFRKIRNGLRRLECDAIDKSPGASLRSSHKMNEGKYKLLLLLLSLKKQDRKKLRFVADVLPLTVSPMILLRY